MAGVADGGDGGECGEKAEVEIEGRRSDETASLFEIEAVRVAREYSSRMIDGNARRKGWEKASNVLRVYKN